jgi:tripartite-type tricarboxylate transporter receptor subunit TctC
MMMNRYKALIAAIGLLSSVSQPTWAQSPQQPMRLVVPYAAGGITDTMARLLAQSVGQTLGRTVIVDNRPGAGSLLGIRAVQKASADGDTLLFTNPALTTLPLFQKDAQYDPVKDFSPVAMVGNSPTFVMVHTSVPASNMAELIAYAKKQPDGIEAANAGPGSISHLQAALFAQKANVKVIHVPYKGTAETATALITGQVKMQINSTTEALNAQAKAGKIKMLAVGANKRTSLAPDVPTVSETIPGFNVDSWFGIVAPAGTPPATVTKLSNAFKKAVEDPDIRQRFHAGAIEPVYATPEELSRVIANSQSEWQKVVKTLQVTTDR